MKWLDIMNSVPNHPFLRQYSLSKTIKKYRFSLSRFIYVVTPVISACLMTSSLPSCFRQPAQVTTCRQAGDEKLGFEGCVAALGTRHLCLLQYNLYHHTFLSSQSCHFCLVGNTVVFTFVLRPAAYISYISVSLWWLFQPGFTVLGLFLTLLDDKVSVFQCLYICNIVHHSCEQK